MSAVMSRAEARAARAAQLDPSVSTTMEALIAGSPEPQAEQLRGAVTDFCAWIERAGTEFGGYDEAYSAYAREVEGTDAASGLPFVQLLLAALDERTPGEGTRGAHAAA